MGENPLVTSAIAGLRSATWPSHQRLEKRLDVKTRFTNLTAYRAHVEQMWGFCAALEQQVREDSFDGALEDYESRRKLPLLTLDLLALGVSPADIKLLARCAAIPCCADTAAAFGCIYVLEGATLGGRTLLPLAETHLGFTGQHGAAFLASYGDDTPRRWRNFGVALDAWCATPERQARATTAAVATFDALAEWLCGAPS